MSKAATDPTKSWRDVITIHPAADLFPLMSAAELAALGEDIRQHGLPSPVVWWCEREADIDKSPAPQYYLLDGRDLLDAMEIVGIKVIHFNGKEFVFDAMVWEDFRYGEGVPKVNPMTGATSIEKTDPFEYVLSANLHRRHLTAEQKRELIAKILKAQPAKSNRTIAKQTKVDDKTVGSVRRELEGRAEIPHVLTVEDTKGRQQPTKKARGTADANRLVREIMVRDAATPGYALAVVRGIVTKLADFPDMLKREMTAPDAHA